MSKQWSTKPISYFLNSGVTYTVLSVDEGGTVGDFCRDKKGRKIVIVCVIKGRIEGRMEEELL